MGKLNLGVDIRDFDLERLGFSLYVLDETKKQQESEAYLRMSLPELDAFVKALKAAPEDIDVATVEPSGVAPLATIKGSRKQESAAGPSLGVVASAEARTPKS